jgi:hypothetical protein
LGLWFLPESSGGQPGRRQLVLGALVWRPDRLGSLGRVFGLAPYCGRGADLAGYLHGLATHGLSEVGRPVQRLNMRVDSRTTNSASTSREGGFLLFNMSNMALAADVPIS